MVGRLEKVDLRKVWEHEAHDFTTWLSDHLDILSEQIDLTLSLLEREHATGSFDMDTRDRQNRYVADHRVAGTRPCSSAS